MKAVKRSSTLFTLVSVFFILTCAVFFINSTSDVLTLNIISYFWPLLFVLGIIFGVFIIKKFKNNSPWNMILSIIVICLCMSSLGFYSFIFYLGKTLGA